MALIPAIGDPSLILADKVIVGAQRTGFRNRKVGMGQIGNECSRQIFYAFRQVQYEPFDAPTIKRFEDGHNTEAIVVARLAAVPEFEVHVTDENGQQFRVEDFGGHFSGALDGSIRGLIQAPKSWHVLEGKASAKWKELEKTVKKVGEKNALAAWNPVYYGQGVLYMDYTGMDRHYLVCASPGGREWTSCRTNADPAHAGVLKAKAERIIFTDTAPDRIGGPDFYLCRWCDFSNICHEGKLAERNCRTCLHSEACRDGSWQCRNPDFPHELSRADQEAGCGEHRYLPTLIAGEQVNIDGGGIVYRMADGSEWIDAGAGV